MLKRIPSCLRVTQDGDKFDALNELHDKPMASETLYAYELIGNVMGHACVRASGGRGGIYPLAHYRLVQNQPPEVIMRDTLLWRQWVDETYGDKFNEKHL